MTKPVLTKKDFVRRYARGEFGNASPTWSTYWDWMQSKHWVGQQRQLYHIRNRIAGEKTWYDVPPTLMAWTWSEATN